MKKIPLLILGLTLAYPFLSKVLAQAYKSEKIVYYDASGKEASKKNGEILAQLLQLDDSLWEINIYQKNGPRLRSLQCSDPSANTLNGRFIVYGPMGDADTIGVYSKGIREGTWYIYAHNRRVLQEQFYKSGELIWTKDSLQLNHERDSINEAFKQIAGGQLVEEESGFEGGPAGWLRFLNRNLRYPDDAVNNNKQGTVIVGFVVDTLGHIPPHSAWIDRSVEFSLDQETLRIIAISPDWKPASRNGKPMMSYKRQPIVYRLEVFRR